MNRLFPFFVSIVLLPILARCGPEKTLSETNNSPHSGDIMDVATWDFGDQANTTRGQAPTSPLQAKAHPQADNQYAIVVATFTGDQHEQSAQAVRLQLLRQYPSLHSGLTARKRSRGTALTFGNYQGYTDTQAEKDIAMLHTLRTQQGVPLFAQVLLMKFKSVRELKDLHPFDLWTVRREFPTMVPIFTLEVAVWGDFNSGQLPTAKRRASAENYAGDLRRKGFESYFYHNDSAGLSSVTVGLFGSGAVDAETGFYSYEVEAMLSRFPVRLVNGQEVQVYFDPSNHSLGSSIQPPCLAEVPVD